MATYATWDDVKAIYELEIPDPHKPRVEALLKQASARLSALVPSLAARVAAETVDADLPRGMVVQAVLRTYRNPAGLTQQATGPFSRSLNRDAARGDLYFDPDEVKALLAGAADSLGIGTFQVGIPAPVRPAAILDAGGRYSYTPEQARGL